MATADLKTFVEDRLRAMDPTIDLDTGAPAQVQFIEPLMTYLGTDPFETNIDTFISDRFRQEFPDIYAQDPGVVRDVFVKPLIALLEPFKREIQTIKKNQSLKDPTLLSDDDADALVANVFDSRDAGSFSVGTGRLIFGNPTNIQIEISNRFYTTSGLGFFPTNPLSMTAEEMVFNKTGSNFYLDVPLKAEKEGTEYDIGEGELSAIDGQFGVLSVTNLQKFSGGAPKVDTPTFVAAAHEALNERSLVTRRGATARVNDVFQNELRAFQVIGAKDAEMERDLLVANSPGHARIIGQVILYKNVALVSAKIIDGDESVAPTAGDTLFVYLDKARFPGIPQNSRMVRLTVTDLFVGPLAAAAPYQMIYLVGYSGSFPAGVSSFSNVTFDGGISDRGSVAISSLPDVGATNLTVGSGEVHVYGHTDFYVRPVLQPSSTAVISTLADTDSLIEQTTLQTFGLSSTQKNVVQDTTGLNFASAGVRAGQLLSIETGDDIGIYPIIQVSGTLLYLNVNLTNSQTSLRYRVIEQISINPFEPRVLKFPFGSILANDLNTTIGSTLVTLSSNDLVGFGAKVGDTLRILTGVSAGDYLIEGWDTVLGGRGPILNKAAPGTSTICTYEVFSPLEKVERPLVRLKQLSLLDSSSQSTGIDIPYAEPVGVVPTGDFSSARVRGLSQQKSGFVLPSLATTSLTTFLSSVNVGAPSGDRRYSLGFDTATGIYKPFQLTDGSYVEFDYRANPTSGVGDALDPASYFVATVEDTAHVQNYPPIDPKVGDALYLKSGPNKGGYIIKDVIKLKYRTTSPQGALTSSWVYFIKINGKFPVDVFGQLFDFFNSAGSGAHVTELPVTGTVSFPGFFTNLYNSLGTKMAAALSSLGAAAAPSASALQTAIDSMMLVDYEWGDPARGTLRSYFLSPTLMEQQTGTTTTPTLFSYETPTGDIIQYQPDPAYYLKHSILPARTTTDPDLLTFSRDLSIEQRIDYTDLATPFTVGATLTGDGPVFSATLVSIQDLGGGSGYLFVKDLVGDPSLSTTLFDSSGGEALIDVPRGASGSVTLTDTSRSPILSLGAQVGDVLSVYEEIFLHGPDSSRQSAIQTTAGSTQITSLPGLFTNSMVGDVLYIEQGKDKGGYRIVKFVDSHTLVLDRALTESTPSLLSQGSLSSWGFAGTDFVTSAGFNFSSYVGKYITLYGLQYTYQGSYAIAAAPSLGTATITRALPHFPFASIIESTAYFVITDAPTTVPATSLMGTELYALRPIRIYSNVPNDVAITSISPTSLSTSTFTVNVSNGIVLGVNQPYQIYRKNVRRVNPSEMQANTSGPLVYFDTDVVSLTPREAANITTSNYLTTEAGTYTSLGYRHIVADRTRTYSVEEEGTLTFSPRILPTGVADSEDNFINLVGSSVQVTYEQSDLVQRIQEFANSTLDRVASANILVRHFLPAYISYDASYYGGDGAAAIAKDIISYINNLTVETPIDVSVIQDFFSKHGGNMITPTSVQALIHDWSRRVWVEFSENQLGGTTTDVPYDGSPRVSFFVPGPDASGATTTVVGERIMLTRS